MRWIVKVDGEKNQRIRIKFSPVLETIHFYGEYRVNNKWIVFSHNTHIKETNIDLNVIMRYIETILVTMRKRIKLYDNINEGFSALKLIGFEDSEDLNT